MKIDVSLFTIIVLVVFIIGYLAIFISVITQPVGTSSQIKYEFQGIIDDIKKKISSKEYEIKLLRSRLDTQQAKTPAIRPGVIILGMHRSGTSVLGGLINKMGLKTGGPLIQAAEDNAKGFFERIDVVLQNDRIMKEQRVHYSHNTYKYDTLEGIKGILNNINEGNYFKEGERGLSFLNDESNYPWMLKDPRLCITFRTWLPLLNFIPAIIFTYRHPLDVALSMNKREYEQFPMRKTLKLWYIYNRQAVVNSHDLCRVVTSHRLIMKQPQVELDRIYDELHTCGVDVPKKANEKDIKDFIDIKLQHGQTTLKDTSCEGELDHIVPPSTWRTTSQSDIDLYRICMKAYCAMEDRSAFTTSFRWDMDIKDD